MKKHRVFKNLYRDSVTLMQLASRVGAMDGVELASALMATPANIAMMLDAGLLDAPPENAAPNDLILAARGNEDGLDEALDAFERLMAEADKPAGSGESGGGCGGETPPPASLAQALKRLPEAGLALISTPGEYAAAEAMKALRRGLNVMLFSDNVSVEREIALKRLADEKDLLVMGPDCGTAIIAGAPLAFANVVRRGDVGLVSASGTGAQEVSCILDRLGRGVSHVIGTGGRDLSERVGGLSMAAGVKALARDPETRVMVLISKPPSKAVADRILALASATGKPSAVCFLGAPGGAVNGPNLVQAETLEEAAHLAAALAAGETPDFVSDAPQSPAILERAAPLRAALAPSRKYLRALYCGGTFCYEAQLRLADLLPALLSNAPAGGSRRLGDPRQSAGHVVMDLGDDFFTRGRPHPMIDPAPRNERILREAADPETAVILADVVLGFGANPDPAGELARTVARARDEAREKGRAPIFIAFVCGTAKDPQDLNDQRAKLEDAGIILCDSNAQATALAGAILAG